MRNFSVLLRLASVVALVQFLGHLTLFVFATQSNQGEEELVKMMKTRKFEGILNHSYWDLYFGYGLMAAFTVLGQSILLWQIGTIAQKHPHSIRGIVLLTILMNLLHVAVLWKYFTFPLPITFDLVIVAILGFALLSNRDS